MTQEFEKSLLDYITEIKPSKKSDEEIYNTIIEKNWNEWEQFLPPNDYSTWAFKINDIIKSNTSDFLLLYGEFIEYQEGNTFSEDVEQNSRGFILILDKNIKPIKTIYEFSSGTKLRPIQKMIQCSDGTFIAIDSKTAKTRYNAENSYLKSSQKRVIQLNDISLPINNEFKVILRKSYIMPQSNFKCMDIFENPNTSHYGFVGIYLGNSNVFNGVRVIELKINVGTENEWNSENDDGTGWLYGGCYGKFTENDRFDFKMIITKFSVSNHNISLWKRENSISLTTLITLDETVFVEGSELANQCVFMNENLCYLVSNNQRWSIGTPNEKYVALYEFNLSNNSNKEIYKKNFGLYEYCEFDTILVTKNDGELYIQYCNNVSEEDNVLKADYNYQRYNGIWKPIFIGRGNYKMKEKMIYVSKEFNLINIIEYNEDMNRQNFYLPIVKEIYSKFNYNGLAYDDYNELVPKYANIYSNDDLLFSRDIYNLSIINNYSISTVQIPNNYLNDISLTKNELIGSTNKILVEEENTIEKNIYEGLFLNYINTLNAIDNDNNYLTNASNYINQNINVGTRENHENTKCSKARINYNDDTSKIFDIIWVSIDNLHKITEFSIYVDKEILSIDFISNDEEFTYMTITPSVEINKYYTIKQKLKVGDN